MNVGRLSQQPKIAGIGGEECRPRRQADHASVDGLRLAAASKQHAAPAPEADLVAACGYQSWHFQARARSSQTGDPQHSGPGARVQVTPRTEGGRGAESASEHADQRI